MKFQSDFKAKQKFNKITKQIERKLATLDSEIALEFVDWFDRKANYLRQTSEKCSYCPQPDDLAKGDVVWVEFGINVGTELSDHHKKGHYALVWAIDLGNVIVIPLSSKPIQGSKLSLDLGIIDELNNDSNKSAHSYLKLDAIRSICKRRINRMSHKENGKITLDKDTMNMISKFMLENFI